MQTLPGKAVLRSVGHPGKTGVLTGARSRRSMGGAHPHVERSREGAMPGTRAPGENGATDAGGWTGIPETKG